MACFLTPRFPLSVQLSAALACFGLVEDCASYGPIIEWWKKLRSNEKVQLRRSRHIFAFQNFAFVERVLAESTVEQ